ncbi:hypothetical protein D8M36_05055 [Dermabacter sp. HSID17554]|nr:hypothetical protein D8M36_05055 [Dermabacter sp. HSID17554]
MAVGFQLQPFLAPTFFSSHLLSSLSTFPFSAHLLLPLRHLTKVVNSRVKGSIFDMSRPFFTTLLR